MTQLLIALRFYALGSMQISVADFAGVSVSSVCRILVRVSEAIARQRPNFVKMPESDAERQAAFHAIASFPRVIGSIDCTHVKIQSPGGDQAEQYRNIVFAFDRRCIRRFGFDDTFAVEHQANQ